MLNIEFSNINETVLLLNGAIMFNEKERRKITLNIPTIGDSMKDPHFQTFVGLLHLDLKDFKDINLGFAAENKGELFIGLLAYVEEYRNILGPYLQKYIHDLTFKNNFLYVNNQLIIASEMEYIINVLLVSFGYKKLEEVSLEYINIKKEEEDRIKNLSPIEKRQEETKKRLAEVKAKKAEKQQKENKKSPLTLDKIIIAVMDMFKYNIQDINNMNYFALYHLFGYVYKIDSYDIMKQIYANGNLNEKTEFKHWLD